MSTLQGPTPAVILASGSASRRAVLQGAGIEFSVHPAAVDEAALKESALAEGIPPGDAAVLLAEAKAGRVATKFPEALVIGSDQLLVCEHEWFDKPEDMEGARRHLQRLRGRRHQLVNGTVVWRGGERIWHQITVCQLTMRDFSDEFLESYLALEGEAVLQSVGAYRVEGPGIHLFSRMDGEHSAILGLPLLPLLGFLRQHGVLKS